MSSIADVTPATPDDPAGSVAARTLDACTAALEVATLYLGERLGLYEALAEGPATAAELAGRAGLDARYVREWSEQQAVAGVLTCADPDVAPDERTFALPAGHREALLDGESLEAVAGLVRATISSLATLPLLLDAFRTGAGIPYAAFGDDMREGIADGNRPLFLRQLGQEWLPAMPDVHERLRSTEPARVADVACGCGWSSIAIGRAYPSARVDGLDEDAASIAQARTHAAEAGLADRVRFFQGDAADAGLTGTYDLVTIFEALHDMAQPVEALRSARSLLGPDGCVLVADERAAERFTAPAEDPLERLLYCYSVLHCLPVGRVGRRRRPPAPSCGRTRSGPPPPRPASSASRSCRSTTTSGASTDSIPEHPRPEPGRVSRRRCSRTRISKVAQTEGVPMIGHDVQVTWYGHGTWGWTSPEGLRVLVDPFLSSNPSTPEALKEPDADLVLVTHGHGDHIGDTIPLAARTGATVVAPTEIADWLSGQGVADVVDLNQGGTTDFRGVRVTMTKAEHTGSLDQPAGPTIYGAEPKGYVITFENGFRVYQSGDTDVFGDMALIRELWAPDLAVLPIGDHYTMGPFGAAHAVRLLGVRQVLGGHWGTFPVLTGTPAALREELATLGIDAEVLDIEPGQTLR